jgi:hypothetical protein
MVGSSSTISLKVDHDGTSCSGRLLLLSPDDKGGDIFPFAIQDITPRSE